MNIYEKAFNGLDHRLTVKELNTFHRFEKKIQQALSAWYTALFVVVALVLMYCTERNLFTMVSALSATLLFIIVNVWYNRIVAQYAEAIVQAQERILNEVK